MIGSSSVVLWVGSQVTTEHIVMRLRNAKPDRVGHRDAIDIADVIEELILIVPHHETSYVAPAL
jgi:hypothetical protein